MAGITLVSGLPRSGTSMMMQMLAAGGMSVLSDANRPADDSNPRGYFEFEPVKDTRKDASWVDGADDHAVKVIHVLLRDLPDDRRYRVIFMERDLDEVLASQRAMLDRLGQNGAALPADQLRGVYAKEYDTMRAWLEDAPHMDALWISYNELVASPAGPIERICAFVDESLDADAMRGVIDPDLYRERGR